jgi:hypothetical protein
MSQLAKTPSWKWLWVIQSIPTRGETMKSTPVPLLGMRRPTWKPILKAMGQVVVWNEGPISAPQSGTFESGM